MTEITLPRDGDRDLRFTGELIAEASSSANNVRSDYSGAPGRWAELALYRTASGKLVAQEVGRTQWEGEHDRHSAWVCETEAEVIDALGTGWLAKMLYEAAEIECIEEID